MNEGWKDWNSHRMKTLTVRVFRTWQRNCAHKIPTYGCLNKTLIVTTPVYWGLRVSDSESVTIMVVSMVAGRKAWCWSNTWEFLSWSTSMRKRELYLLTIPKWFCQLGPSIEIYEPIGGILIQTTTPSPCFLWDMQMKMKTHGYSKWYTFWISHWF